MRRIIEKMNEMVAPWEEYSFGAPPKSFLGALKGFLKRIYFWSQKEYMIRYLPFLNEIKSLPVTASILEVGSGPVGISRYTKRPIVGVDINTQGPHFKNMKKVYGNAWELPFESGSFDCVISSDMLEHIPRQYRARCVNEILRVAKVKAIIGFPCGDHAEAVEKEMRGVYHRILDKWPVNKGGKDKFILRNNFLLEHDEHTLPKFQEVQDFVKESKASILDIKVIDNESCHVWYWGVLGHMKYSYARWFFTTMMFIVLFPILSKCSWGGTYRKVFVIYK